MDIRVVDPRDTRWEIAGPAYRVYFWERTPLALGAQDYPDTFGYSASEFELTGADVEEVLSWANGTCEGRIYTLYAVVLSQDGLGLVRLAGIDPTVQQAAYRSSSSTGAPDR